MSMQKFEVKPDRSNVTEVPSKAGQSGPALLTFPSVASEGGVDAYFRAVQRYPILSAEEENALAVRYRDHDDQEAANKLVTSHLRFVAKIASGYRHYGLPLADLISEGNLGLIRAIKKFEPERGFRLSTYAMWWIKAAINEYVLSSWSMVKMGTMAAQKKLFFNLRKLKAKLGVFDDQHLSPDAIEQIARQLHVSEDDVVRLNGRITSGDSSLNVAVNDESALERMDLLVDEGPNQEERLGEIQTRNLERGWLKSGLEVLNDRERAIIVERRLSSNPQTLEELGQRFGVSRERVRQIENRAFEKLQQAVLKKARDTDETRTARIAI